MDFKHFLNHNKQVIGFINAWSQEYIKSIHYSTSTDNDIQVTRYQVRFCSIYRISRDSFTVECQTIVKYLVVSENLSYTTKIRFWIDGLFREGNLFVSNYRVEQPLGVETLFNLRLDLIPYMTKEEYELASNEMIGLYYPEFLSSEVGTSSVDAMKIAERMGLNVVFLNISEVNEDQRAMVKFDAEPVAVFDMDTGEIYEHTPRIGDLIVDSSLLNASRIGELNNAILHECVHWEYHWQHFEFKKILSNYYGTPKLIPLNTVNDNPEWSMEVQAKGIAPRVLMPRDSVEKIVVDTMGEHSYLGFSNVTEVTLLAESVKNVAEFFSASKQSAKIRLKELGFSNNSSVYNYVDGSYVPNYISSASGIASMYQTYNIGVTELINLASSNQELAHLLLSGEYVYADSFVCLNDSRFVETGPFGRLVLTDEALNDVSNCCLAFSFEYLQFNNGLSNFYEYTLFKLSDADFGRVLNGFSQNADSLSSKEEPVALDNFNHYIHEIVIENNGIVDYIYDINLTFEQTVSEIVDYRGYDNSEFMNQTNLNRNFLNKLRKFEGKNYEELTLLRLFVGLKIPNIYLERFFNKAGKTINPTDVRMMHISQIISIYHGIDIDSFEKLMKKIPA